MDHLPTRDPGDLGVLDDHGGLVHLDHRVLGRRPLPELNRNPRPRHVDRLTRIVPVFHREMGQPVVFHRVTENQTVPSMGRIRGPAENNRGRLGPIDNQPPLVHEEARTLIELHPHAGLDAQCHPLRDGHLGGDGPRTPLEIQHGIGRQCPANRTLAETRNDKGTEQTQQRRGEFHAANLRVE